MRSRFTAEDTFMDTNMPSRPPIVAYGVELMTVSFEPFRGLS